MIWFSALYQYKDSSRITRNRFTRSSSNPLSMCFQRTPSSESNSDLQGPGSEQRKNESTRCCYKPLTGKVEPFGSREPPTTPLFRRFMGHISNIQSMVAYLLAGFILMVVHHLFFSYLNGKSIEFRSTELPSVWMEQANVSFAGTTIAHAARIVLSIAVGISFNLLFWRTLRTQSFTFKDIETLADLEHSPLQFSTFRIGTVSFPLLLLSCGASAMGLLVIITPGSLTVTSDLQRLEPCNVSGVREVDDIADFRGIVSNGIAIIEILLSSVVPSAASASDDCAKDASLCSYNVTSTGPMFDCTDISNQTDFSAFLLQNDPPGYPLAPFLIWSAAAHYSTTMDPRNKNIGMSVLTRDLENGSVKATNCTAYRATYEVGVILDQVSNPAIASVQALKSSPISTLEVDNSWLSNYTKMAVDLLVGNVYAGSNGILEPSNAIMMVQNSPLFSLAPSGNYTWTDGIADFLSAYMQNVSMIMLSGGFEDFANTISTCSRTFNAYSYNPIRLLSTYAATIAIASLTTALGYWSMQKDDKDPKEFRFSRILQLTLNEDLFLIRNRIQGTPRVQLERGSKGRLLPTLVDEKSADGERRIVAEDLILVSDVSNSSRSRGWGNSVRILLGAGVYRMIVHILAATCCMVVHHEFYQYLDGKAPNLVSLPDASPSSWLTNQAIASDIGTGLAYVGQTLFSGVIMISSAQLFWRTLRLQACTISQIDALMNTRANPISLSLLSTCRVSLKIFVFALLATSMSAVSIFAPGSIKVTFDQFQTKPCTVFVPRDLTTLTTANTTDYLTQAKTVLAGKAHLPLLDPCGASMPWCGYSVTFVAPGLDCRDVTPFAGSGTTEPTIRDPLTQDDYYFNVVPNGSMVSVAVGGKSKNGGFQIVECEGAWISYSGFLLHEVSLANTSMVWSTEMMPGPAISTKFSPMTAPNDDETGVQSISFGEAYLSATISALEQMSTAAQGVNTSDFTFNTLIENIPFFTLAYGHTDMTHTITTFSQNMGVSILSGQILLFNDDTEENPSLLENATTTCTYQMTAYEYTQNRLFVTYGIAMLVTILCAVQGSLTIRQNGVTESMRFSRFLRAILNERMFRWYVESGLELDTSARIKADENIEGSLAPVLDVDEYDEVQGVLVEPLAE